MKITIATLGKLVVALASLTTSVAFSAEAAHDVNVDEITDVSEFDSTDEINEMDLTRHVDVDVVGYMLFGQILHARDARLSGCAAGGEGMVRALAFRALGPTYIHSVRVRRVTGQWETLAIRGTLRSGWGTRFIALPNGPACITDIMVRARAVVGAASRLTLFAAHESN